MTVAAQATSVSYSEDGTTLAFPIPFRFLAPSDIQASRTDPLGVVTSLVNGTDYTVAGGGSAASGTLTLAATIAGDTLGIYRATPRVQSIDYATNDSFPSETAELGLDRDMLIEQEQDASIGAAAALSSRALRVPLGETIAELPAAAARANLFLAFAPDGSPLLAPGTAGDDLLRADLAAPDGAGLSGFSHAQTYADGTVGAKLAQLISVKDAPYLAVGDGVADDTAAILAAIVDAKVSGRSVGFPAGRYVFSGSIALDNVSLVGSGVFDAVVPYDNTGSVILLTSTSAQPFQIGKGVAITDLTFFWPGQDGSAVNPVVYPPLFQSSYPYRVSIAGIKVVNAYDFWQFDTQPGGAIRLSECSIFAARYGLNFQVGLNEFIHLENCWFSHGIFESVTNVAPYNLRKYYGVNGACLNIDCGAASYTSIDGLALDDCFFFGARYGLKIASGSLSVSRITGSFWDGVGSMLSCSGGAVTGLSITGGSGYFYNTDNAAASNDSVEFLGSLDGTSYLSITGFNFLYSQGDHIFVNTSIDSIMVAGGTARSWGRSTTSQEYGCFTVAQAPNATAIFSAIAIKGIASPPNPLIGVLLSGVRQAHVVGCSFTDTTTPVSVRPTSHAMLVGNASFATSGSTSLVNTSGSGAISGKNNNWDKPTPLFVPFFSSAAGAGQTFTGAKTVINLANETMDEDNAYASNQFVAPVPGIYDFSLGIGHDNTAVVNDVWALSLEASTGTIRKFLYSIKSASSNSISFSARFKLPLAGTVIAYVARVSGTGNLVMLADGTLNYIDAALES